MIAKKIKYLKHGEFFTLRPVEEPNANIVWIKDGYVGKGEYSCYKFADVNHERFFKKDRIVYTEFTF